MASRRPLVFGLVLASLFAPPGIASAATPISVSVITGFQCVSGSAPSNTEVIATLRTPGGQMRGRFRAVSEDDGSWGGCFPGGVNGNDRLRVVADGQQRNIVIPRLEPQIDRVEDTISGWATPDAVVVAQVVHHRSFNKSSDHSLSTQADGDGRYSFDTTGEFNLRGNDVVTVLLATDSDTFGALVIVPHLNVVHANNSVTGAANNGTDLLLTLTDKDGSLKADVTAGTASLLFGISLFTVNLFDDDGAAAYPVGGDRIAATLADDASLQIPVSSLRANAGTDVVTGRCMANVPFLLLAGGAIFYGRTDAKGRFTRDVGNQTDLLRGDGLSFACLYATGDTWSRHAIAL